MTRHKLGEINVEQMCLYEEESKASEFILISDIVRQKLQLLSVLCNHGYHVIIFSRELCRTTGERGLVSAKTICIGLITMLIDCNPYQSCPLPVLNRLRLKSPFHFLIIYWGWGLGMSLLLLKCILLTFEFTHLYTFSNQVHPFCIFVRVKYIWWGTEIGSLKLILLLHNAQFSLVVSFVTIVLGNTIFFSL